MKEVVMNVLKDIGAYRVYVGKEIISHVLHYVSSGDAYHLTRIVTIVEDEHRRVVELEIKEDKNDC